MGLNWYKALCIQFLCDDKLFCVVEVSVVDYQSATFHALTETGDNPIK